MSLFKVEDHENLTTKFRQSKITLFASNQIVLE